MMDTTTENKGLWHSKRLLLGAVLLIVSLVLYRSCDAVEKAATIRKTVTTLQQTQAKARTYEVRYKTLLRQVSLQPVRAVDSEVEQAALIAQNDSLQTVINKQLRIKSRLYARIKQVTRLAKITIPYLVTVRVVMTDSLADYLKANPDGFMLVPRQFRKRTPDYLIAGTVQSRDVAIDTLEIYNQQSIQLGYHRKSWLAPYKPVFTSTNTNPYILSEVSQSILTTPTKKKLHLGLQVGYGLTLQGPGPYVGAGLTYQPF